VLVYPPVKYKINTPIIAQRKKRTRNDGKLKVQTQLIGKIGRLEVQTQLIGKLEVQTQLIGKIGKLEVQTQLIGKLDCVIRSGV
jgi:hypothetical protein